MNDTPFKIKADVFWANLDKVNDLSGKYQLDLGNLSQAAVERLESVGINVKEDQKGEGDSNKGSFITCKSNRPIYAFGSDGEQIDAMIGNNSKAEAVIRPYSWEFKGKKGRSPGVQRLVITDLNEYEEASADTSLEEAL